MKLDHKQCYATQILDFIKAKGFTVDQSHRLDLEVSKELVSAFIYKIDLGEHTNNSQSHLDQFYYDLAEHMVNRADSAAYYCESQKLTDVTERNNIALHQIFRWFMHKCKYCGSQFLVKFEKGVATVCNETIKRGEIVSYSPPTDQKCFKPDEIIKIKVTAQSNKLVFANDLRGYFLNESIDFEDDKYDICTPYGRIKCSLSFAEKGVFCLNTGNTTAEVYSNKEHVLFTNGYHPDIEEYDYEENIKEHSRSINKFVHDNKLRSKGDISCSLWWLMGTSSSMIDMKKLEESGNDFVVIPAKKGQEYEVSFNSTRRRFFEYKLAR